MVIITALAATGTTVAAYFVGTTAAAAMGTATLAAIGLATSVVLGAAMRALTPKPRATTIANRGYQVNARGSALDHQIIYGQVRTGGAIVYDEATGDNNQYLHRVIAVAGHEVDSFVKFYLNGEEVTVNSSGVVTAPAQYANKVVIRTKSGTDDQDAEDSLVKSSAGLWTTNHRLSGIAYMYVKFTYDADAFPNGVPTVTALVKGKKVKDPSTGVVAWSDNPALCLRDYLTNTKYGLGEEDANVDDALVATAKTVCDTHINGKDKFSCNGVFTTAEIPSDIIEDVLSSMGGSLWYSQGKWRMKPAYWTDPVLTLNEDDLRSSVSVSTRHSRRDNFNVVKGTFRGEESNWEVTDYPQVTNNDFLVADGGQESVVDVDLPFTSTFVEARRLARITLESNRQQLVVTAAFGLRALEVQVGDNVRLTNSRFGWQDKEFEVVAWTFGLVEGLDLQVNLTLKETAASIFDEVDDGAIYERDNTNLPDPFISVAAGISISSELSIVNEGVVGTLVIDLTGSVGGFSSDYEVEYRPSGSSEYIFVGRSSSRQFRVNFIEDGYYDVRTRTINIFGVKSPYNTVSNWFLSAFAAPPSTVQSFTGNVVGDSLHLSWEAVSDLDLSHYKIRYASETIDASYQNAVDLVLKVARPAVTATVPSRTGTYFIKAVDKLGTSSLESSSFVVTTNLAQTQDLNVVETFVENPDFTGSKNSTVRLDDGGLSYITLDTSNLFDATLGDFDDEVGLFDGGSGGGQVFSTGTYEFSDYLDLGVKYTSRVSVDLKTLFLDYVNTFDSATGLFDSREGDFNGDPSQFDLTSVQAQVSYTDDDPSGTPTWSAWQNISVSDVSARAIKFRVVLSTQSGKAAPAVTELVARIDMPDRVESGSGITYTGSQSITFPVAFKVTPAIGLATTLANGDRYEISSRSRAGFTITTYTGVTVSSNPTTIDYVAKGYGKEIT
jgi:hypothetical protein